MSFDSLFNGDNGLAPTNYPALLLGVLMAFAGGHVIAWVYMATHSGLSYSRSFVKSLAVMPVVVALVMDVMSDSLVTAFGMMAVFTIVRFRNMLRDTLDTTYILLVLVLGMATGSQKFSSALVGLGVTSAALLYLSATNFGTRHRYDLILNLHWGRTLAELRDLEGILARHTRRYRCANQRISQADPGTDLSYWLLLRDAARCDEMLSELRALDGVSAMTSVHAEDESEV